MEENNIHGINEFDFNLICEYFSSTLRQGPGSDAATLRALAMVKAAGGLPADAHVADFGCGTGSSALVLARELATAVTAVDLFPQFIEILGQRAKNEGVEKLVRGVVGNIEQPPFEPASLDLIWCEGAIYNVGFERGMREWARLLRPGGYIAASEPTWLTRRRPAAIARFWNEAYPEVRSMPVKIRQMMAAGLSPVGAFLLPNDCWTTNYYIPQREAQRVFLERHADNPFAVELVRNQRHEAAMFDAYNRYYGYVFYICRKL